MSVDPSPSIGVNFFDLPTPVILDKNAKLPVGVSPTSFVYNFYVRDESIDDKGAAARAVSRDFGGQTSAIPQDAPPLSTVPRYIRLVFSVPSPNVIFDEQYIFSNIPDSATFGEEDLDNPPQDIRDNAGGTPSVNEAAINTELTCQPDGESFFAKMSFQDLNVNQKLYTLVKTSAQKKILKENERVQNQINARKEAFLRQRFQSQADLVRVLRREVPAEDDFLTNALNDISQLNERFIDPDTQEEIIQDNFKDIKRAKFTTRLNTKFINSMLNSAVVDPIGTYSEELISSLPLSEATQQAAIESYIPSDYNRVTGPESPAFELINGWVGNAAFLPNYKIGSCQFFLSGFIVDKTEVLDDGTIVRIDSFTVDAARAGQNSEREILDFNIAYGRNYVYQVRGLYVGEVAIPRIVNGNPETRRPDGNNGIPELDETRCDIRRFFISSAPSGASFITTKEFVPPPPPPSLKISWRQKEQGALVTWDSPANKQRDIKRYQVLKRKTINDPFELIVEIDFDQSAVLYKTAENVTRDLKIKSDLPIHHFVDKNIDKDAEYIYAIRSVDAHGLISQYSIQIAAKYNRFTNRIDSRLISTEGAPAQYPNFYLVNRKFSPTIKSSGHHRMKIYFDPEYLELKTKNDEGETVDLEPRLFNFDGRGQTQARNGSAEFQMQILNVDLQQSETIDILIEDDSALR